MCYKPHDMDEIYFNYHSYSKYVDQKRNIIIYIIILIQGKYSDFRICFRALLLWYHARLLHFDDNSNKISTLLHGIKYVS